MPTKGKPDEAKGFTKEELWSRLEKASAKKALDDLERDAASQGYAPHGQLQLAIAAKRRGDDIRHRLHIAKVGRIEAVKAGAQVPEDLEAHHPIQLAAKAKSDERFIAGITERLKEHGYDHETAHQGAVTALQLVREAEAGNRGGAVIGQALLTMPPLAGGS